MQTINQVIEEKRRAFELLWGLAPEGSLKYKKGQEIQSFIFTDYTTSLLKAVEEMCEGMIQKIKRLLGSTRCEHLHHKKAHRHSGFEDCPVVKELEILLTP